MYQVCGAFLPGAYTSASDGRSGSLIIYAPFILSQGADIMGSDSITGSCGLGNALTIGQTAEIPAVFSEKTDGSVILCVILSATEKETADITTVNCLSYSGILDADNSVSMGFGGCVTCVNTLGAYGHSGACSLTIPSGGCGNIELSAPHSPAYLHEDTLNVTADGRDITKHLVSAEINLFGKSGIPSVSAVFDASFAPKSVVFDINGEIFTFRTEKVKKGVTQTTVTAVMQTESRPVFIDIKAAEASELTLNHTENIIWTAENHAVTDVRGTYTPYELALLCARSRQTVRLLPTGYVVVSGGGSDYTVTPYAVFSWETETRECPYSSVTVNYGGGAAYIEADAEAEAGGYALIKVFGGGSLSTDADSLTLIRKGVEAVYTEEIFFNNGAGKTLRPPTSVSTPNTSYHGTSVYIEGAHGYRAVTYTSEYNEYMLRSAYEGRKYVEIIGEGSVTLLTGRQGTAKNITLPHVSDRAEALRTARENAASTKTSKVTIPRTKELTLPTGLNFRYGRIKGRITAASISIKTDPLIITDTIEVKS